MALEEIILRASDVQAKKREYLTKEKWLLKGDLTLLTGDCGAGKSTFSVHIAATIAANAQENQRILYYSTEDDVDAIQERLISNARSPEEVQKIIERVLIVDCLDPDKSGEFNRERIESQVHQVEREEGCRVTLVVLDPLLSFLDVKPGAYSACRREIQRIRSWCKNFNITVIGIIHATKDGSKIRGSGAWEEVTRNILNIRFPGSGYRYLTQEKISYGTPEKPRAFRIQSENDLSPGRIEWQGPKKREDGQDEE